MLLFTNNNFSNQDWQACVCVDEKDFIENVEKKKKRKKCLRRKKCVTEESDA